MDSHIPSMVMSKNNREVLDLPSSGYCFASTSTATLSGYGGWKPLAGMSRGGEFVVPLELPEGAPLGIQQMEIFGRNRYQGYSVAPLVPSSFGACCAQLILIDPDLVSS